VTTQTFTPLTEWFSKLAAHNLITAEHFSLDIGTETKDSPRDCMTLLKTWNLEECESTQQQEKLPATHPAAIIIFHRKVLSRYRRKL
jgi:hypothetical protein